MNRMVLALFLCQAAVASASVYDFEALTPGTLVGQDGWAPFGAPDGLVVAGTGVNTSLVITPDHSGGSVFIQRTNDANYSFDPLSSATTDQVFEFDFRGTNLDDGGYERAVLNLGGPGLPSFGVDGIGPVNEMFYIRAEDATEYGEPIAGAVGNGDWVRLRLTVDFTTGTGSYSYRNLTAGAASYTPVASLQGINLGITTDPAVWDTMRLTLYQSDVDQLFVDNLGVGPIPSLEMPDVNMDGFVDIFDVNVVSANWGGPGPAGDANKDGIVDIFDVNLISANWSPPPPPAGGAVPEPSTAVLFIVGVVLVAFRRLRRG